MSRVFQRQEELQLWDQELISSLTCLVLGAGGLGSTICMDLSRLGVKKIILIDMDTVDEHNLNRQILYSKKHIGLLKTDSGLEQLAFHTSGTTVVENYNYDIIKEWPRTLEFIKQSDVIFNTIDYGDYFDHVICKVAEKYNKPLILGGTEPFYGHTVSYFLQGIRDKDVKYADCHDLKTEGILDETKLEEYSDLSFLPKDSHPVKGGSTVYSAGTCSHLMVCALTNYMFHLKNSEHPEPPKQFIFNLFVMDVAKWF